MILFAALPIPDPFIRDLIRISQGLAKAKWRPPENLHLTLRYFGEVSFDQAEMLDDALAARSFPPIELKISGIGHFGGKSLTSVHAKADMTDGLKDLRKHCSRAARAAGLQLKEETFRPHVTLAYLKEGADPEKVARYEKRLSSFTSGPMIIDRMVLFSSNPKKRGPNLYVSEAEYPLLR